MTENEEDYATLFFTHIQMENEIKELWNEMQRIRNDPNIPQIIKFSILSKLFEVHNALDIESVRQQEDYMQSFLRELNLQELDAKPMTEGRLKVHVTQQMKKRSNPRSARSMSFGFVDPGAQTDRKSSIIPTTRLSGILVDRKIEIEERLAFLNMKGTITKEESEERFRLRKELQDLLKE